MRKSRRHRRDVTEFIHPGETDASARVALALGGGISVDGRDVTVGDGAAQLQFATAAEAEAFAAAAGEPTPASLESLGARPPLE